MKKQLIKILFAITIALIFAGCNKTESPFDGVDNHITSFALKTKDTTYVATISGDKITITVPVNTSLADAKVQYELCENASILPNPSEVKNWNNEQTFRVKSFKGVQRNYTYIIKYDEVSHSGNVAIMTQADVDAFAASRSTVISGNLIIGSSATANPATAITSLAGLSALKEVKYQVIINNSFAGTDLNGLQNLEKCGGLYIGNMSAPVTTTHNIKISLPALTQTGDLILNSNSIQTISLPKLSSVGNLTIASKILDTLKMPLLKDVAGDLSIKNESNAANTTLKDMSFPMLTFVGGSVAMQYYSAVAKVSLPVLSYVGGGIDASLNSTSLEELSMPTLETAGGDIVIERAPNLLKVNFQKLKAVTSFIFNKASYGNYPLKNLNLSSLQTIESEFYLRNVPMTSLSFPKLTSIGGNITVYGLKALETFDIPLLTKILGKLYLSDLPLTSLNLSNLTVLGSAEFVSCLALQTVRSPKEMENLTINFASNENCRMPIFEGLTTITKELTFNSCSKTKVFNIVNITKIGSVSLSDAKEGAVLTFADAQQIGTLDIGSYSLAELNAPKLTKVDELKLSNVWSLATINIPVLRSVGSLTLSEHGSWNASKARMTNLDAFSGVTSMKSVTIDYCGKLANFEGLKGVIASLPADKWSVTNCKYNPTHADMVAGRYQQQ